MNPTLSGAHSRRGVRPWREVPGGLMLETEAEGLITKPCALRVVKETKALACADYARQYLSLRGDKQHMPGQLILWSAFFQLHFALIEVPTDDDAPHRPLFTIPSTLSDATGKLNPTIVPTLGLNDAIDGEIGRLSREYDLLRETQTPVAITHQQWEAIVSEGKAESLKTLVLRHGSSALIQVLHGLGSAYPE